MFGFSSKLFAKRICLVLCMSLLFVVSLAGCGGKTEPKTDANKPAATEGDKEAKKAKKALKVGVVWQGKGSVADKNVEGITSELKKLSPESTIEVKKELKTVEELGQTIGTWENEKDAIVILRSNGVEWLGKNNVKVPVFVGACNSPDQLGVKDMESKKISGSSYYLKKEDQLTTFKAMIPKMESVMLLVDKTNASAPIDQKETKEACTKLGITYTEKAISTKEELLAVVSENAGKVSGFILGFQALVYDNAQDIIAKAGTTPVFSYSDAAITKGALAGFAVDNVKLGTYIAQEIVDSLVNGKSFTELPIKFDTTPKLIVNETTMNKLKITIPNSLLQAAKIVK